MQLQFKTEFLSANCQSFSMPIWTQLRIGRLRIKFNVFPCIYYNLHSVSKFNHRSEPAKQSINRNAFYSNCIILALTLLRTNWSRNTNRHTYVLFATSAYFSFVAKNYRNCKRKFKRATTQLYSFACISRLLHMSHVCIRSRSNHSCSSITTQTKGSLCNRTFTVCYYSQS